MNPIDRESLEARRAPPDRLWVLIQQAHESILLAVLENPHCEPFHVVSILRSSGVTPLVVERIAGDPTWTQHYRVKVALVRCRQTPFHIASHLIYELFWRDLVDVALDYRIDPRLRTMAERLLIQRTEEMSVGERMALAKVATRRLITHLRHHEPEGVVQVHLLQNPRLTEEDVLALLQNPHLPPNFFRALLARPQWCFRPNVRMAIMRHPHAPLHIVAQVAGHLTPTEVQRLVRDPSLRPWVRHMLQRRTAHAE